MRQRMVWSFAGTTTAPLCSWSSASSRNNSSHMPNTLCGMKDCTDTKRYASLTFWRCRMARLDTIWQVAFWNPWRKPSLCTLLRMLRRMSRSSLISRCLLHSLVYIELHNAYWVTEGLTSLPILLPKNPTVYSQTERIPEPRLKHHVPDSSLGPQSLASTVPFQPERIPETVPHKKYVPH